MVDFQCKSRYDYEDFLTVMRLLRGPGGCPWDAEQTHQSIRRNFLEETYEVIDALDKDSAPDMCEELGDVFMQVVFHAIMEEERGRFTMADVVDGVTKKMIFRHPHVFGGGMTADTSEQVLTNWEVLKREEKGQASTADAIEAVPHTLPALWRAEKVQKKAAKAGFDWPGALAALDKLEEEVRELRAALERGGSADEPHGVREELGDALFMAANGPLLFSPLIFKRQAYKWDQDFEPISSVSYTPLVLQVRPGLPVKDLGELLALARKEPGKLNMASPGAGTTNHLVSELLQSLTGARWTTAQYKGNAPATTDLLGGQVDFNFDQISVSLPYIKEGRTRGLAVTTARRVPSRPDIPTFAEAGVPGMEAATFTGLLAPKGTPPEVLARLSQALEKILSQPEIIQRFQELGADAQASSSADFTRYLAAEDARWTPIIERAGITAN